MQFPKRPVIIIPSRLASSRLPNKPLADIHGQPMIVLCLRRALETDIGPVIVACADEEIFSVVKEAGGKAIMTDHDHISGSDRIFEALTIFHPDCIHDCVINFQGDMPIIDPNVVRATLGPMNNESIGISTLVSKISEAADCADKNIVKAVVALTDGEKSGRAIYFSRADVPFGNGQKYHHIGLYTYRRDVLQRFVDLPVGKIERQEQLEQLRALEYGLRIEAVLVDTNPIGVDTLEDLNLVRKILEAQKPERGESHGK